MLKKIISMFMLIIIVTSPCVFAEDETMTEEEYSQFVMETLSRIDDSNVLLYHLRASTLQHSFSIGSKKVPTALGKEKLYDLIMFTYKTIKKYGTSVTKEEFFAQVQKESSKVDIAFEFVNEEFGTHRERNVYNIFEATDFCIIDYKGGFVSDFGYYLCEDKEKVIEEVLDYYVAEGLSDLKKEWNIHFNYYKYYDVKEAYNELSSDEYLIYDRIKFDIKITEETEDSVFTYLGNAKMGDTVKCSIEQVKTPGKSSDCFLFNIYEGEKRRSLHGTANDTNNYDRRYDQNFLVFSTQSLINGSDILSCKSPLGSVFFRIDAEKEKDEITKLYIEVDSRGEMGKSFDKLEAENVTYEYFTENIKQYSRTMAYMFGLEAPELNYDDDDDDIEEKDDKKEDKKEEDKKEDKKEETKNNISVSYMRGDFGNEDQYMDFYVSFIAQADVNISSNGAPEWYKKLGSDVRASVIGITQTVDGDDYQNYTLLCFSGNEGIQWFKSSIMEPTYNEKSERVMKISYSSLLSFNGFEMKRDTVNYDTVIVSLCYENDENKTLKSVGFDFGEKQVNITSDYLNCLGGGKIAYEKLF